MDKVITFGLLAALAVVRTAMIIVMAPFEIIRIIITGPNQLVRIVGTGTIMQTIVMRRKGLIRIAGRHMKAFAKNHRHFRQHARVLWFYMPALILVIGNRAVLNAKDLSETFLFYTIWAPIALGVATFLLWVIVKIPRLAEENEVRVISFSVLSIIPSLVTVWKIVSF